MYTLILSVACDRVIFYTDDSSYSPPHSPYTWTAYLEGDLPSGISLKNCWSWRFRDGKLIFADDFIPIENRIPSQDRQTVRNRAAIINTLNRGLDEFVEQFIPSTKSSEFTRSFKLELAQRAVQGDVDTRAIEFATCEGKDVLSWSRLVIAKATEEPKIIQAIELLRAKLKILVMGSSSSNLETARRTVASRLEDLRDLKAKKIHYESDTFFFGELVLSPFDHQALLQLLKLQDGTSQTESIEGIDRSTGQIKIFNVDRELGTKILNWLTDSRLSLIDQLQEQVISVLAGTYSRSFYFKD